MLNFIKSVLNLHTPASLRFLMAEVYDRCYMLAERQNQPPHSTAVLNSVAHRYRRVGRDFDHIKQWLEVAPFVCMEKDAAKTALGEYMVYLEMPGKSDKEWLQNEINQALRISCQTKEVAEALNFLQANLCQHAYSIPWSDWLDENNKELYRLNRKQGITNA